LLYLYRSAEPLSEEALRLSMYRSAELSNDEDLLFAVSACTEVQDYSLRRHYSLLLLYRSAEPLNEDALFFAVSVQKLRTNR
jgi:hypothetical protein